MHSSCTMIISETVELTSLIHYIRQIYKIRNVITTIFEERQVKRFDRKNYFNSFCYANQWTGFTMIGTSVKKELKSLVTISFRVSNLYNENVSETENVSLMRHGHLIAELILVFIIDKERQCFFHFAD